VNSIKRPTKYDTRQIRYDSDRDNSFADEIMDVPECENLDHCIQCGTCSGACPVSIYMDLTPRRVIHLTRAGFKDDVLNSYTIWLCSSCYACVVQCPREIGITNIMYALKERAVKEGKYPKDMPTPVLMRVFAKMVHKHGRISEIPLVMLFIAGRKKFLDMVKMWRLGLNLMRSKRFSLKLEHMKDHESLNVVLNEIESTMGGSRK
jgi:quinone-modifying oxidoreductase subunit QmoC